MPTNKEIEDAYEELIENYDSAISIALDEMKARRALEKAEDAVLISGSITGSNAEIRAANLRIATAEQRDALYKETKAKKNIDGIVETNRLYIESLKWQIRNTENILRETEMRGRTETHE
jgi:hypothetical protein